MDTSPPHALIEAVGILDKLQGQNVFIKKHKNSFKSFIYRPTQSGFFACIDFIICVTWKHKYIWLDVMRIQTDGHIFPGRFKYSSSRPPEFLCLRCCGDLCNLCSSGTRNRNLISFHELTTMTTMRLVVLMIALHVMMMMMMMMICILWWSVCLSVTKNDHSLLGISCNHMNHT